jgi:fatty acid desaturase
MPYQSPVIDPHPAAPPSPEGADGAGRLGGSGESGGTGAPDESGGSDFAPLLREIRDRGLLRRRRGYYTWSILSNLTMLTAVWVALFALGDTWWSVLLAVPAALLFARTGFLGHDAGHAQIARTRRSNRLLGLLHGNLMLGMSYGWWTDKHNKHHANPNHVDKDPDVQAGALVWTSDQATGVGNRAMQWLARHQAKLFFPMLLLEGLSLKVDGFRGLPDRSRRDRIVEGPLLVLHVVGYLALVFAALPVGKAVVFIAIHQALFGLHLGMAFAPNHKGMPMPGPGERWGHLRRQVLTSRNIRGGYVTDWMLGGLNYQVEHHLFPNMPRPYLRQAQPVESYVVALRYLHSVGERLRAE